MSSFNANLFANIPIPQDTSGFRDLAQQVTVLPLNLLALIISHIDSVADLARICQTSRVLHYMTLPQLYKNFTLTSYKTIRYKHDQAEGQGSASPFSMGLNALVTRNVSNLVRTLALQGDWREHDLVEYSRVGRVPDDAMMLNIAVRAAVDRCTELRSFKWDMSTKLLPTVYHGLASLPHLRSLHLRFPSSRAPRPVSTIPAMPNLTSFTMTEYDPLCFPDDVSLLLLHATKLHTLKMHFSVRMRDTGEPSVQVLQFFRKNIAAKRKLRIRTMGIYNLFAQQQLPEMMEAIDIPKIQNITFINTFGQDEDGFQQIAGSTGSSGFFAFFDESWARPPKDLNHDFKSQRYDRLHKSHALTLSTIAKGLERLYMVNARHDAVRKSVHGGLNGNGAGPSPSSVVSSTPPNSNSSGRSPSTAGQNTVLRDMYLDAICTCHGSTLKHLIFPYRWPLSSSALARLIRACPNLVQLSLGLDVSTLPQMRMLVPFLQNLWAMRLLLPPDASVMPACMKSGFDTMEDAMHEGVMAAELAAMGDFPNLKFVGLGEKVWEVGGVYEEKAMLPVDAGEEGFGGEGNEMKDQTVKKRRLKKLCLEDVRDVEIWKMDSQDVV